ncbi:MAG: hypothetical protein ACI4I1_07430 [Oscillospiraceae bacterium]
MLDDIYDAFGYAFVDDDGNPIDLDSDEYACKYRDNFSGKCLSDLNGSEVCAGQSPFCCGYYEEDE